MKPSTPYSHRPRFMVKPLLASLLIGLSPALMMTAPVQAAEQSEQFNIAPGPLSQTLNRFAQQAGVAVIMDQNQIAQQQSKGLQGSFTVSSGFAQLLDGSGFQARETNSGYVIEPATTTEQQSESVTLSTVQVSATGMGNLTEGSRSYTTGSVNSVNRLNMSLRETPQTITVVTSQQIKDFGYNQMDDVLRSTSGVYVYNRGLNGGAYLSRGFSLQTQYDGVQNPWGISEQNRNPSPDSAILDHVEIVQGASGLLTGAGDPGGTVNMVRKMPTATPQSSFELSGGSWDFQRAVGDVSGPLIESGAIRGRMVMAYQKQNSFVDYEYSNRRVFYGVLEGDLTDTTTVTANVQFQNNKYNDDYGVQMGPQGQDLGYSRSAFFGASWGELEKENRLYTLRLDQQLANDWQLRATFNRSETDVDNEGVFMAGEVDLATGDGLGSRSVLLQREFASNAFDIYLSGPVQLFNREHELVFGANTVNQTNRSRNLIDEIPANLYTYDPATRPYPSVTQFDPWPSMDKTTQEGIYTAGRFNLNDSLKLILGARMSWFESESLKATQEISPYVGIVQDLNEWASVYASYSDIFNPQDRQKASGDFIEPVVGSNYEVGVKTEFYGGKLNAGLALFRLEQTNLAEVDETIAPDTLCDGSCYTASGKVVSEGIDINLAGELLPGWNMMTGYSYVDSEYASGEEKGQQYNTQLPQHIFRLSTIYQLPQTKWSIGGDMQYHSKVYQESANYNGVEGYRTEQGGVALVGLLTKYQINERSEVKLNVNNLFDRKYFESVGAPNYYNTYGAPRSFYLTYSLSL